jgi:hypothetical protein
MKRHIFMISRSVSVTRSGPQLNSHVPTKSRHLETGEAPNEKRLIQCVGSTITGRAGLWQQRLQTKLKTDAMCPPMFVCRQRYLTRFTTSRGPGGGGTNIPCDYCSYGRILVYFIGTVPSRSGLRERCRWPSTTAGLFQAKGGGELLPSVR